YVFLCERNWELL
nr:immunoglobulin heavy chain junction region [Mus musculus]